MVDDPMLLTLDLELSEESKLVLEMNLLRLEPETGFTISPLSMFGRELKELVFVDLMWYPIRLKEGNLGPEMWELYIGIIIVRRVDSGGG
jgi:hypothetical protein